MKFSRLIVLTVAIGAGAIAAILAGRSEKVVEVRPAAKAATVDVLVAKSDIAFGQKITPAAVWWQPWPIEATSGNFVRRTDHPRAIEQFSNNMARYPFVAGEPIREAKLINPKGSGFMAAILEPGMRAISTSISAETSAGGFILPNDYVDVIMTRTRQTAGTGGGQANKSETILKNVRVLAIDQNVQEKDGQKVVIGKTATLELTPSQAENLAQAHQDGILALSLRSMSDAERKAIIDPRNDEIVMYRGGTPETYACSPICAR